MHPHHRQQVSGVPSASAGYEVLYDENGGAEVLVVLDVSPACEQLMGDRYRHIHWHDAFGYVPVACLRQSVSLMS